MKTIQCTLCGTTQPATEFPGQSRRCKECLLVISRSRRVAGSQTPSQKNDEPFRAQNVARYAADVAAGLPITWLPRMPAVAD